MENITKLHVAPKEPVVNKELVVVLEQLLADAKLGKVTAAAGIFTLDNSIAVMHAGVLTAHDCLAYMGMLDILKNQLMEDAIVSGT